jgi:flavin-dependent dehydrogenase
MIDLLVAGGGPAGAAAAAAASAEGLEVELLDAGRAVASPRGESLPPGAERVLDDLFGAGALGTTDHRPAYANRSRWGGTGVDMADFMLNPLGHGWHVDRRALDASLLASVKANGTRVGGAPRIAHQSWAGDRWEVDLTGPDCPGPIHARAIVDATGRASRIARSQGARRRRLDRLVAAHWLVASADEPDRDSSTLVEAVPDGWWYTSPVGKAQRTVVFLTDADLLPKRERRTREEWNRRLSHAPQIRAALAVAGSRLDPAPRITDAGTAHLDRSAGPGWVATGDAAVSFDPLSSQGILTAVLMGREAGRAAAAMLQRRDPEPLVRYGRRYAAVLERHLTRRGAYYGLERRWSRAPFWARR